MRDQPSPVALAFWTACLLLVSAAGLAETVSVKIPAVFGVKQPFDLGVAPGRILDVTLHVEGMSEAGTVHCFVGTPEEPSDEWDSKAPRGLGACLYLDGCQAAFMQRLPSGDFTLTSPFELEAAASWDFLGTGVGEIWLVGDLYYPEHANAGAICEYSDPGKLEIVGDPVLTVEFEPSVPVGSGSWGALKATYR
jgi:hypothetical protein